MQIEVRQGLRIGFLDVAEALAFGETSDPAATSSADVLRVRNPDPAAWPALERAGFVLGPSWVNWRADVHTSHTEYLETLTTAQRRAIRNGERFCAKKGIEIREENGLTQRSLNQFLDIYDAQVSRMSRGVDYARQQQQEQLLNQRNSYLGVFAYQGDTMVAGALFLHREADSLLQGRYSAASPEARQGGVLRALYVTAFGTARSQGLRHASLGNDPALYGHVVAPGLFYFKARLGFVPQPAHHFSPEVGDEQAFRVISLKALTDPALLLGYPEGATETGRKLRLIIWSSSPDADVEQYRRDFLVGSSMHVLSA